MAFANCNEHIIHYEYLPKAGAKTIAFVNSLGTDFRTWDKVVEQLKSDFAILRFDKRGHGLSELPKGATQIQDYAKDLNALLEQLNIEQIHLVGLSIGGMISMAFTNLYPEKVERLVLCDTAPVIGNERDWNARINIIEQKGLSFIANGVIERWFGDSYRNNEPIATEGYKNMLTRIPVGGYNAACAAIRDADLNAELKSIKQPTLCVCGDEDASTPPALVQAMLPSLENGKYTEIAQAGHLPCVEQPDELTKTLLNFLKNE